LEQYKNDVASLKHQVKYYQEVRGATNLRKNILEEHDKHLKIQDNLVMKALALQ